jgi:glycosyltransferase involved in cell wall biosynthesis
MLLKTVRKQLSLNERNKCDFHTEQKTLITNKNMKVAHLTFGKKIGGVERDFSEFIGHPYEDVTHYIVTATGFHSYIKNKISDVAQKIYSLSHCCNLKIPGFLEYVRTKYIISKLKPLDIDLWLLWNIFPTPQLSPFILSFKTIYYEHGECWKKYNFTQTNKKFLEEVSAIICNSYAAKRILELKWGINNKCIKVSLNALRPGCKPFNPETKSIKDKKIITLGVAGRVTPHKGFPLAIHALNELKKRKIPCQLLVAGTSKKLPKLKDLVSKLNLTNEVKLLGLIDNMNEFYSQIDIFLCPSIREPFGLVVIEAMAHGCPVIIAGVDGLPETLQGSNSGVVIRPTIDCNLYPEFGGSLDFLKKIDQVYDPYTDSIVTPKLVNPTHLSDAVEYLWNNPDIFSEMSKNAIQLVNEKFDYDKHIKEIYETIKNVFNNAESNKFNI